MFFNAHAYHVIRRSNNTTIPLRITGALLADSALTGTMNWTGLHGKDSIQDFIATLPANYEELGQGLMDHYDLDRVAHESYENGPGYAYSHQTPELRELAAKACGVISANQAEQFAHNFIESGVDMHLLQHNNGLQTAVREALEQADIEVIGERIASFFGLDAAETTTRLTDYADILTAYDLQDIDGWMQLWSDLIAILLGHLADAEATRKALTLAAQLTADDYQQVVSA